MIRVITASKHYAPLMLRIISTYLLSVVLLAATFSSQLYATDLTDCSGVVFDPSIIIEDGFDVPSGECAIIDVNIGFIDGSIIVEDNATLYIYGNIDYIDGRIQVHTGGQLFIYGDIAGMSNDIIADEGTIEMFGSVASEGKVTINDPGVFQMTGAQLHLSPAGDIALDNGSAMFIMNDFSSVTLDVGKFDNKGNNSNIQLDESGNTLHTTDFQGSKGDFLGTGPTYSDIDPAQSKRIIVTETNGNTITAEDGPSDYVSIVLGAPPTISLPVTITLFSSDLGEGTVSTASVTFTSLNWDTPQVITITGTNDNVAEGTRVYELITSNAVSGDLQYNGMIVPDVVVLNRDNGLNGTSTYNIFAPTAAGSTITSKEDSVAIITVADLGFADDDGDDIDKLQVSTLPVKGILFQDNAPQNNAYDVGEELSVNDELTKAEIDNNEFNYIPDSQEAGNSYASFDFYVNDGEVYSDASATITFDIVPVNDSPVFTLTGDLNVDDNQASYSYLNFFSGAADGDPELTQNLTYQISTDDPSIFSVLPSINFGTGELTFTLANKASVVANITVTVTDDGGTVNGGLDETTKTFKIKVFDEPQSKPETIPAGSYIVDMGSLSPTIGNSLKPYGLIFDLTSNYQVPVKIAIRMDKEKDEIDFSHEGRDYRGAPFIISAEYRTDSVNAVLDEWELQGVEGYTTTTEALNVPIYVTFTAYTTWTVDQDNEAIAANYFDNAGIPLTSYTVKPPSALDGTDDIFILPHADPSWANHGNLYNWNKSVDEGGEGGWIWAGCHAVSVLESLVNPADVTEQMNFLTTNSLVSYLAHDDGSVPYSYDYPAHPFMQFMQDLDAASVNGSEQVYLPSKAQGSSWLSSTKIAVWDPDQSDVVNGVITDGEAAVLAFGHSFGDPRNGKVLYQGGHDLDGGNIANIAAQRAFFNFSILAPVGKVPIVDSISVPAYMDKAQDYDLSISATTRDGSTPSYYWSSGCGGSFDDPTSSTPTYTSPSVVTVTTCIITVTITDSNGRQTFESVSVTMTPNETPTFTSLTSPLEAGILTDEFEITFAELEAASDASDVEGPIAGYLVTNLYGGTLSLGTSSGVATPYAAGSNDTINASINAYWAPSSTGVTSAFDIVALDSEGSNSVTDIPVNIKVVGFSVTESGGTTVTSEAGGTDFISIVLDVQPTTDVQLDLVISPASVASVNVASVTFDNTNWDTPQVITITGQDDATPVDGDDPYTITFSVNTGASDDDFDLMTDQVIAALNVDNDDPGFTITPLSGITVNESGTTANFTISLQSSPSAAVDVTLWSNDLTEGDVNPKTFSFTNLNWNAANSFTVTGADDLVEDGDINYLIVLDPAVSGDPTYDNMDPADVTVTTADNDVSGIQVTLSGGSTVTSETGTTDTIWVQLNTEPSSDVVIDVTSADLSEGTVSPGQLTFTDTDWNVAQLVIVTGVNDNVDDGDIAYNLVLAVDDAASDDVYDAVPNQLVSVTNQNDDVAGILVSPTSLTMSESGAPGNFSIVLNSQPTQDVSIGVSSSNTGEATVNVSSVTFTPGTWNTPKQVAVTGQDDTQVDGNSSVTILVATATSTDSKYSGMNPDDVAATIQDDDTARFIVTPTSLSMNEGTTGTFDVVLGDEPQGTVNLTVSSSNSGQASIDFTNLSFDNTNWSVAQTVTVTGEEDANLISESPSITISVDASSDDAFDTLNNQVVNVTLADNDLAGFTVTPLSLSVDEGSTNTFTVVLDAEPSSDVTISLTSSNTAAATVDLSSVVFDNTDWSVAQTVTVTGVEDANLISETPTITASIVDASSDDAFDTLNNQVVNVTLADNDLAGFTVTPLSLSVNEGSTNTFTVVLDAEPSSDVTISLTSSNTAAATVDLSSVVFDNTDWSVAQTVTITGVEDANVLSETPTITASIVDASSDDAFDTLNNQVVNVTLADNDLAGFTVTPLSLSVNEGSTNTFTVVLDAEPSSDVTISLTSSNTAAATVDLSSVVFDNTDWSVAQTVTITGVEDANVLSETPTITASIVDASSDDAFDTLNNQVVNVTLADNDLAGFTVTPLSLSVNEGSTNTFTVVLDAEPSSDVTISLTSSNTAAATVDLSSVVFDNTDWSVAQTVTITGVEDANVISETPTITASIVDASSDDAFDTLNNQVVNVTLADNDLAGFTVTPLSLSVNEGSTNTFTVVLDAEPSSDVTISLTSSNTAAATVDLSSVVFDNTDWSVAQTVTITGVEDANVLSETPTITASIVDASSDDAFDTLNNQVVNVTLADNDLAGFTVTPLSLSVNEGSTNTFTVVLDAEPSSDVTISLTSSNTAAATVDLSSVVFDNTDWSVAQTVTITGVEDANVISETPTITASIVDASSDDAFDTLNNQVVNVTLADNDLAGFTVTPLTLSVNEGSTNTFTVVLDAEPSSDVTIALTSSNTAAATVDLSSVVFDNTDWSVAQTVTVTGVEDANLISETPTITASIVDASSDDAFDTLNNQVVNVTLADNDLAGFTVTPLTLSVNEGSTNTFTVVLDAEPSSDVTIALTSSNTAAATVDLSNVVFDNTDWSVARTVTITGVEDANLISETPTITASIVDASSDDAFDTLNNQVVNVTLADNDLAGFTVTPLTLSVDEGSTNTFTVVLDAEPSSDVTISLTSSNTAAATVDLSSVVFDNTDWSVAQTVTVTGVEDANVISETPTITASIVDASSDDAFDTLNNQVVNVTLADNDEAGFTVTPLTLSVSEGSTNTFTVVLDAEPASDVTIALTSSNTAAATVDLSSVVFDNTDWSVAQTVTITGVEDANVISETPTITASVVDASSDDAFDTLNNQVVNVTLADNDLAGFTVTPLTLSVNEGSTNTFTVVLDAEPASDVTISLTSSNTAAATVDLSSVVFDNADWSVAQTVTITGVEDANVISETPTITASVVDASSDDAFDTLNNQVVNVTLADNDLAGFTVTPLTLSVNEGSTNTFTVVLDAEPADEVFIDFTSSDHTAAITDYSRMSFDATNWNISKTVTVSGVEDANLVSETPTITLSVDASSDDAFDTLNNQVVNVTLADNDLAGYTVTPLTLSVNEGSTNTFTVVLDAEPADEVFIDFTSSDHTAAITDYSRMSFDATNWNISKTVTVSGVEDANLVSETPTITLSVDASSDDAFDTLNNQVVNVTLADNDLAGYTVTPLTLSVNEGSTNTFTVVLDAEPADEVFIDFTSSDHTAAITDYSRMSFDATNWNISKTVTVSGVEDANLVSETPIITLSVDASSDDAFDTLANEEVNITLTDNDEAGFIVTPDLIDLEEGEAGSLSVVLSSAPSAEVTITMANSHESIISLDQLELTFTAGNWDTPQSVIVTALEDDNMVSETATITVSVSASADASFAALTAKDVEVNVSDPDEAAFTVTPKDISTTEGSSATFNVVLNVEPTSPVFIDFESSDPAAGITDYSRISFDAGNWESPRVITVTGIEDMDLRSEALIITASVAATSDPEFVGLSAQDVSVSIADDDTAGLVVSPQSLSVDENSSEIFDVRLSHEPLSDVVLSITLSNDATLEINPVQITFTTANWNLAQEIIVNASETGVLEDLKETSTISVSTSDDALYLDAPDQTVDLTVVSINNQPEITGQVLLETTEDTPISIDLSDLMVSDVDNEYPTDFELIIFNGSNYSISGNTITPAANYNGILTVPVAVNDGGLDSEVFDLEITVSDVNDAPSFVKGNDISINEDTGKQSLDGWANSLSWGANNESNQTLSFVFSTTNDGLFESGPSMNESGDLTFESKWNAFGTAEITVILKDDGGTLNGGVDTSEPQVFNLEILPVNDQPTIIKHTAPEVFSGVVFDIELTSLVVADPDNNFPEEFKLFVLEGDHYSFTGKSVIIDAGYTGALDIMVKVSDGELESEPYPYTVNTEVLDNVPPSIRSQEAVTIVEDSFYALTKADLIIEDEDSSEDELSIEIQEGNLYQFDGLTITPHENFNGLLAVNIVVNDGEELSEVFQFMIQVTPVNDAPITMADTFEVALGETLTANVLENDADIESDELTTQLNQNNTTHSEFELSGDGNFIFRSNDVIGEYVQFYTVCDKGAPSMCAEGMIIITVVGEDFDGDGIPDDVEIGAGDTDEDGTPDYQDTDSDNDGLSDQLEAGDDPTEPVDTDGDGLPDYRDLDSDDDTRPDSIEGFDDCDNDGIANYIDADELCERILAAQGFSPNGDGINDEWIIEGIDEYPDNVVQIFNRWGMIVWESTGYNNGDNVWKGDNHSKKGVPDGTYFYIVSFGDHSGPIGSENRIQGFIVISR